MLLQFNVSNYKSLADEATLDLTATGISELSQHVIGMGKEKALPVCAIFGANASGKSNVYQAFSYMQHLVLNSFKYGGSSETNKIGSKSTFPIPPRFAFSKRKKKPASFEVHVIDNSSYRVFTYGFAVDAQGIAEEWLFERAKTARKSKKIIYRNRDEELLEMPGISAADRTNITTAIEPEVLVISLGTKLRVKRCIDVSNWFFRCETTDYGNPSESYFRSMTLPHDFSKKKTQVAVMNFFATFDNSIKGFKVEELPNKEGEDEVHYYIETLHQSTDSNEIVGIDMRQESAGTLKMFSLYPSLIDVLTHGSVLFVDELNARLHPLLMRNLIILFTNLQTNPNHAQLLFTTHDTWHLSNNTLRRDEIWFTEKNQNGESALYSLAEFKCDDGEKIRKDEHYEKNYLLGKYRAIPDMKTFQLLFPGFGMSQEKD